ncbi:neurofilament heavy polypeptide-like isoform X2 [Prorops nasuta]
MREGIFVKDLLHRGPASESGRIHPGDRIASVKISFRNMVYEDALTILSYASPYDVELEVESGGTSSKPTTLLKKSVGPTASRICHPLYRSQSIPELSQAHKSAAKRLFIADPNESMGSNYSTMNSTLKSTKSTPASHAVERRHDETPNNHYYKFGIKVLPALDGTVHRIENQNEHNTNLERRHSRKIEAEKNLASSKSNGRAEVAGEMVDNRKVTDAKYEKSGIDETDKVKKPTEISLNIPSEVPTEVHNAAMAARRNRKSSSEMLQTLQRAAESGEAEGPKSPQRNKRKAPAPPKNSEQEVAPKKSNASSQETMMEREDTIDTITDYTDSLNEYVSKVRESNDNRAERNSRSSNRRNSESDTDSELQNSFTTIELNPADITIHRTPVPESNDDENENEYRKAASLGDLSKYENKASATLERAQSLDMTDNGSKKRKAPLPPPEDINESTEDLTKLDQMDTFDRRKLKKSSEWGTLEDAIWSKSAAMDDIAKKSRTRKKSNGTLERSKSAVEIKLKEEAPVVQASSEKLQNSQEEYETSIELFNLPLSKRLTAEFIRAERMFNPDEDNSLARIVNDGRVLKSPTPEEVELDFRQAKPFPDEESSEDITFPDESEKEVGGEERENQVNEDFSRALRYFETHSSKTPPSNEIKVNLTRLDEWKSEKSPSLNDTSLYVGKKAVVEEPMTKLTVTRPICPGCEQRMGHHDESCTKHSNVPKSGSKESEVEQGDSAPESRIQAPTTANNILPDDVDQRRTKELVGLDRKESSTTTTKLLEPLGETRFAKRVISVFPNDLGRNEDEEEEYEFGSNVTVNSKNLSSPSGDRHNISNVSVSSGENSEDSGLVRESMDYNNQQESETRPPLPLTPMPPANASQKMTYITEIKVSPNRGGHVHRVTDESRDSENKNDRKHEITVTSNGKPATGKKPPVPPRRSDITKLAKDESAEKQVVYVSEYKPSSIKDLENSTSEHRKPDVNKKFEHWIFLGDNKDQNPWENGSSQPQTVTNIMLSSGDDNKIIQQ